MSQSATSHPHLAQTHYVACPECDTRHRRVALPVGQVATCCRCHTVLYRSSHLTASHVEALAVAALITLVIAHSFPIVSLNVGGIPNSATLIACILDLWKAGSWFTAAVVGATALLFPILDVSSVLVLLLTARFAPDSAWRWRLSRLIAALRPWGMTEVFVLGVVVSLIKLSHLALIVPGPSLWAFAVTAVLLTIVSIFDLRSLWEADPNPIPQDGDDLSADLVACSHCGLLSPLSVGHCPRCHSNLHYRKPESLSRVWALLIAAAILYIPANVLPIMSTTSLMGTQSDTILSGVVFFWTSGSQGLAILIFTVSILIPLMKLAVMAYLAFSVQQTARGQISSVKASHHRARLFRVVEMIGRWSMLDVFVVALMVGLVRFNKLAMINAGPAAAMFGGVVVLTMLAARSFDPRLIWDRSETVTHV